ncbi:MAG TPA: hypothetical protein V6D07_15780 [Trichocoleus sp.]
MSESANTWYIVQTESGSCEIISAALLQDPADSTDTQKWGPFTSQKDAIARRVGLIRSGKCKPI